MNVYKNWLVYNIILKMNTPYMIRYVYYYILFLFAKLMQLFQSKPPLPQELIKPKTPVEIYEDSYTQKFLKTFEPSSNNTTQVNRMEQDMNNMETDELDDTTTIVKEVKQYSQNIDKIIYSRKELLEILKDPQNELEKKWASNILFETTPRGNIAMHYDIFKQGFAYYADQQVSYSILNVAAMKYCMSFGCRDFFVDEQVLTEENTSPFIQMQVEEEKNEMDKKKEKVRELMPELKNARFAKFKNYSNKPKTTEDKPNTESTDKKESIPAVEPIINRFIYMGKMVNFSFLQKIPMKKPVQNKPLLANMTTKYDGMFQDVSIEKNPEKMNYKDYKALIDMNYGAKLD